MKFRWVLAGVIGLLAFGLNSCTTSNSPTTNTGAGFLWVATQGDQMVRSYTINLTTGATAQVGSSVATGVTPLAIAITPAGDALFVANSGDNTVSAYGFNSDGSLKVAATVPTGKTPVALRIDPSGKFLFVANQGTLSDTTSSTVSVFSIQGTGLTEITGSPFRTVPANDVIDTIGTGPSAVAVSAVGNFVYVANQFTSDISIFSYDSSTGAMTLMTTCGAAPNCASPRIVSGTNPSGLAFSRCAGTTTATTACPTTTPPIYLFVANTGSNDISIFSACVQVATTCPSPNGTLTQVGSPVGAAGTRPISFIVDPALDFVYAVDNGSFQVSQYKFSSATGALTALSPATASTGASPLAGGITSDGNWVFIPNNGGSNLSAFSLKTAVGTTPSGQLSVGTAITLSGQPSAVLVK